MRTWSKRVIHLLSLCGACCTAAATFAQTLPPASRTVYKCQDANKTYYSDSPCLGAQRVDLQPTRGMDSSSGREMHGKDVQHEKQREAMAEALRPLTGMDAKQLNRAGRRAKLLPDVERQCRRLDREIPQAEQTERLAKGEDLRASQLRLLNLRSSYRSQGCE